MISFFLRIERHMKIWITSRWMWFLQMDLMYLGEVLPRAQRFI